MKPFLRFERDGAVVVLTMDDPALRNPLSGNTAVGEFVAACARIEADPDVRAVVITGADPAFSSGGSLDAMREDWRDRKRGVAVRAQLREGVQPLSLALHALQVPTIAAVNGAAIGGGCDLACLCDIRIAAKSALFACSFIKVGIVPGDGGAWALQQVLGYAKAAELFFTGDRFDAQTAKDIGLVGQVVEDDQLLEAALAMAERIVCNPPRALRLTKRLLREAQHSRMSDILELSAAYQAIVHETADNREAINAFVEKRPPVFTGD